ncbi:MAG: hypothetical protein ACETWE_14205 [Candidatus Bathyarchaeia archaeon]
MVTTSVFLVVQYAEIVTISIVETNTTSKSQWYHMVRIRVRAFRMISHAPISMPSQRLGIFFAVKAAMGKEDPADYHWQS